MLPMNKLIYGKRKVRPKPQISWKHVQPHNAGSTWTNTSNSRLCPQSTICSPIEKRLTIGSGVRTRKRRSHALTRAGPVDASRLRFLPNNILATLFPLQGAPLQLPGFHQFADGGVSAAPAAFRIPMPDDLRTPDALLARSPHELEDRLGTA